MTYGVLIALKNKQIPWWSQMLEIADCLLYTGTVLVVPSQICFFFRIILSLTIFGALFGSTDGPYQIGGSEM